MHFDAAAALTVRGVLVELGEHTYRIPPRPAADWIRVITEGGWTDIVPGWLVDAGDELDDPLEAGLLTHDDLARAAKDALTVAAGVRKWWIATTLIHSAGGESVVLGEIALSGMDLTRCSLGAYVQAVYRIYTRHADAKQRGKVDFQLEKPPPGVSAAERFDEELATENFEKLARARGLG